MNYELNETNTNTVQFLKFMKNLTSNMSETEKKESVFIMDNLKCHYTLELFEFYYNNNLKILFNVPYNSMFNMIEIVFRYIKNITYKKIYSTKTELKNDLKIIIEGEGIQKSINNLYNETLNKYKDFLDNNISFDLNGDL